MACFHENFQLFTRFSITLELFHLSTIAFEFNSLTLVSVCFLINQISTLGQLFLFPNFYYKQFLSYICYHFFFPYVRYLGFLLSHLKKIPSSLILICFFTCTLKYASFANDKLIGPYLGRLIIPSLTQMIAMYHQASSLLLGTVSERGMTQYCTNLSNAS